MARPGFKAKLYRLSTGTRSSWGPADANGIHEGSAPANLVEVGNVRDVTLNLEKGEADVTARDTNGWRAFVSTLKDGSVEFEMIWKTADEGFAAMFKAWITNTTIACAVLDGDKAVNNNEGLWADFEVLNFTRNEPLEEGMTASVSLRPANTSVAPQWVRVTGGSGT